MMVKVFAVLVSGLTFFFFVYKPTLSVLEGSLSVLNVQFAVVPPIVLLQLFGTDLK
jgi:hypothetical protein